MKTHELTEAQASERVPALPFYLCFMIMPATWTTLRLLTHL